MHVLREQFPRVPFMALTATATPRVRKDILCQLGMRDPNWFLSSFNRGNLRYEVRQKKGKVVKDIATLIKANFCKGRKFQSGIVYCLSKKECDETARELSQVVTGLTCRPYHAGLNPALRAETQDLWVQDKVKVVCATIAFGMGIDKVDVRFVIHNSLPKSIEGYYQESGRAGRDGETSHCILFYSQGDVHRLRKLIDMGEGNHESKKTHFDNLWKMARYCENVHECRRALQLEYFGEVFDVEKCKEKATTCDNCLNTANNNVEVDITAQARALVEARRRTGCTSLARATRCWRRTG